MIEYLIDSASAFYLAGCVYVAYLTLHSARARTGANRAHRSAHNRPADYEASFRVPGADYYI